MKKWIAIGLLLYGGCSGDTQDTQPPVDKTPAEGVELSEQSQSLTTQAWWPAQAFNEAYRGSNYYTATTPTNHWTTVVGPNTETEIRGTVRSGDNTSFWFGNVDWSFTQWGAANLCVLYGCNLYLCMNDDLRGYGTCTPITGQGTTSSNMELHGTTNWFAGLRHRAYETLRWTLIIGTWDRPEWTYPMYVNDFTVTVHN